ncbi:hypothetical protein E2C01_051959 [Portunus trituberculatus]|uniref:Uncharacterized protein n=1 Tax=Portunus trituberculatus TaxID=210409 RepID=A0A5B7GL24_PORTR|nr:hypothetical protein [Portunus trituberculatus]
MEVEIQQKQNHQDLIIRVHPVIPLKKNQWERTTLPKFSINPIKKIVITGSVIGSRPIHTQTDTEETKAQPHSSITNVNPVNVATSTKTPQCRVAVTVVKATLDPSGEQACLFFDTGSQQTLITKELVQKTERITREGVHLLKSPSGYIITGKIPENYVSRSKDRHKQ